MSRSILSLSILLASILSVLSVNAAADENVVTSVEPSTQQSTTTTVNPVTQETTSTTTQTPVQKTTITRTNPDTGVTTTTVITTAAPAPQEPSAIPQGYLNCFNVASGWYQGVWIAEHRVCQYDATKSKDQNSTWVDGYWNCTQYKDQACTKWAWHGGHWVKAFSVY